MTRVLVTGARGLLGSTLVPYLQACGFEVIGHARKAEGDIHADLADGDQVNDMVAKAAPDIIINLAALTNVDLCERHPQLAYLSNVKIVENLASSILNFSIRCHLVHLSTDQVYDGVGPHREENITLSNYYAFSKYASELAAERVLTTTLRTNFFGPSRCPGRASLSDWLVESLKSQQSITVFDDVSFSPLSLQTLARMINLVISRPRQGVFNLGSRQGMSKADFAFALAGALQLPVATMTRGSTASQTMAAYRPKDMRTDSSRFEQAFDVELPTLTEEIESMKVAYASKSG
jgi:dTDP-4-dehydrorhamnose reductase